MKAIGLCICALVPLAAGVLRAVSLYRRAKLNAAFFSFAKALEAGVVEHAWDQALIFHRFQNKVLEERGFLPLLRTRADEKPLGALFDALTFFLAENDPGKETKDALLPFAQSFGTLGMEEQTKSCFELVSRLKDISDRENKNLLNGIRLSLMTGAAVGGGFLILFW